MQGTVVMLLALSGLGCHHKKVAPVYVESCYSSCYSDGCYSSTSSSCYSSCYSGAAYSPAGYSCYSCYSSCYTPKRHHHGLFGHKRKYCEACCAPGPDPFDETFSPTDWPLPVFGTYTPVFDSNGMVPMTTTTPSMNSTTTPSTPEAPSPGTPPPAPKPVQPGDPTISPPPNPLPVTPTTPQPTIPPTTIPQPTIPPGF